MKHMLLAGVLSLWVLSSAHAGIVTYDFWLNAPNGYPITNLVLYATDGVHDAVELSPVTLAPSGNFQLSQPVDFTPTQSLVLGITERDKDDWWDILMFTNNAYAAAAVGRRYDALFPTARNLGHNQLTPLMQQAHHGDASALAAVTAFLRGPDAAAAYFDPTGSFSIIQFSVVEPPIGGSTAPEPTSLALAGFAGVGMVIGAWRRRRQQPA